MRQGQNSRRSRGRGGNNNSGGGGGGGGGGGNRRQNVPLRHQNFDSNGPDVRIRGSAFQVYEKYLALARDAQTSGDRVAAENYFQHAEHYFRIINQINEQEGRQRQGNPRHDGNGYGQPNGAEQDGDEGEGDAGGGDDDREAVTV
ncbi:DUF4167 domain-containing protein [Indioceanicola profundi]|uniref:DUF4167 domain-containing protein n=1 Tax=Indioceanicola profundi TaxID=2220096 RepID=UPI000E6A9B48|nr:DUF4167 domain-containing protein [Indioceanicola profundi]